MNDIEISFDVMNVVNMLKGLVNAHCEKGYKWYPEAPSNVEVNLFELNNAIHILEENANTSMGRGSMVMTYDERDSE